VIILTLAGGKVRDVEDMLAAELGDDLRPAARGHLLLDFTHVEQLGSAELGTLIRLHKRVQAAGGRLTLFNLSDRVYEVFTVTRLHTFLTICRERPGPV
jgi:anti-anti-sigma factor